MILKNGDIVSVPVTATITGNGTAPNVKVHIPKPTGVVFLDFTSVTGSYVDGTELWTIGEITTTSSTPFSETGTIRYTVTDSCEIPFNDIVCEISFDGVDYPTENNFVAKIIAGESCCQVMECWNANAPEQYKQVWVDSAKGDDTTGLLERFDKPYETIQQALVDVQAEVDNDLWTINIRGIFTGTQADLMIPNKAILNFENVVVSETFVLEEVAGGIDMAYLKGHIRTAGSVFLFSITTDDVFCFDDIVMINDGTAPIFDGTAVNIYLINAATNSIGNHAPLTTDGQALIRIPGLN